MIRSFRRNKQYVQAGLVGREFLSDFLRSFDYPQMEDFSLYNHVVIILQFFLDSGNVLTRESRNNTVYQCSINATSLFEPGLEFIAQVPQFDILVNGFFQFMAVQEDQLTRENDQTLCHITVESLETMVQQLSQFARIRRSRSIFQFAGRIESDTSFGCIGDNKTHFRLFCQLHEFSILGIRVQRTTDDINHSQTVDSLSFIQSLQIYMIQTILRIQHVNHTFFNRLYDNDTTVKICLLVHIVDNPIHKCTQEVTFTKLNDSFRTDCLKCSFFV